MTTINFPSSPSTNDTYSFNGKTYVFDGTKWKIQRTLISADTDLLAVDSGIVPDTNVTYDLGSSTKRWRDLYLSGNTIDLNGVQISADETGVILPEGSKIGTDEIGSGSASASTLTKTFEENETASVTLANPVTVTPLVSATKEISQTGIISKGGWDVRANGSNYSIYDSAYDASLSLFSGYKIQSISSDSIELDVDAQIVDFSAIGGLSFNNDGTKLFILDITSIFVHQYSLTTPFDLSTGSYDSVAFDASTEVTFVNDLLFNQDGTAMYLLSQSEDRIYIYSLSTGYDLTTASYSSFVTFNNAGHFKFNSDGTKIISDHNYTIPFRQYDLSTPYDISTISTTHTNEFDPSEMSGYPVTFAFNGDGTKLFIVDSTSTIYEYALTADGDLSSPTYTGTNFTIPENNERRDVVFNNDGTKFYVAGRLPYHAIHQYSSSGSGFALSTGSFSSNDVGKKITGNGGEATLLDADGNYLVTTPFNDTSTIASGDWSMLGLTFGDTDGVKLIQTIVAYDIENAIYTGDHYKNFAGDGGESKPTGIVFKPDGTKMFIVGSNADVLLEYNLPVAFDVTTSQFVRSVSIIANPAGIAFNNTGSKAYILVGTTLHQYSLSTPYDTSTLTSDSVTLTITTNGGTRGDLVFNNDGTKLYIASRSPTGVQQFSLSTPYDISTAVNDNVTLDVSSVEVTPTGLAFNSDGTQLFMVGLTNIVRRWTLTTAYDVSTATYDDVTFSVSSEETVTEGLTFNSDGTKMYVIGGEGTLGGGSRTDGVAQYSTGNYYTAGGYNAAITNSAGQIDSRFWLDINSMTADETLNGATAHYAISTDNHTTWSIIDNTDGVRNIVRNNSGTWEYNDATTYDGETWVSATVNEELPAIQESLEEGNAVKLVGFGDVSTWTDDSVSLSIAGTSGYTVKQRGGLAFNNGGTKMFASTDDSFIAVYTLTTPYDISTATYNFTGGRYYYPSGIKFNNDGTKFYLPNDNNNEVLEFTTTAPFEVRSATETHSMATNSQTENPVGLTFNDTGSKMFVVDYITGVIYQYNLSTPFGLSTATYNSISFSVASEETRPQDIAFNADGTKMYVGGYVTDAVHQYSLSTPYDITTASYDFASFAVSEGAMRGMTVSHDGTKMYTVGYDSTVRQYSIGSQDNYNRMTSTQLGEVSDANHFTLEDSLDLAIILSTDDATAASESDGISINYDAEALNKSAVVGVDYEFDFPDASTVRVTSLTGQNLKVKILEA